MVGQVGELTWLLVEVSVNLSSTSNFIVSAGVTEDGSVGEVAVLGVQGCVGVGNSVSTEASVEVVVSSWEA